MNNKYFNYLCNQIADDRKYDHLLGAMDSVKFRQIVANDDNRAEDGKKLREDFIDRNPDIDEIDIELLMEGECSVLEMMIALSNRLEFETAQSKWEKTPKEWFWILVDNLGLSEFDNYLYVKGDVRNRVREILYGLVRREYGSDGNGGLFPLKNPKHDQRKIEIWYQMTEYIMENYPM